MRRARVLWAVSTLFAAAFLFTAFGESLAPSERSADYRSAERRGSRQTLRAVQIVDAAGRTVRMEKLPRRIVVVGKGPHIIMHLLYMFPEGRERLVGMEKRGKTASDFLPLIDPGFVKKVPLGVMPGAEQIATLQPDVVLIKGAAADRTSETLGKIGIPVIFLNLETPEEFFRDTANLGILLGNEARAGEIAAFFRGRVERIRNALARVRNAEKPRVLLVMGTDRGGKYAVQVPAASWMQTIQVRTAGGDPVWMDAAEKTSGWTIVNLEQVARWDPDKIFVVIWYSVNPEKMMGSFQADPRWAALKAVKNKEFYPFPTDLYGWDSPEPRWVLGMTWLASKINPGLFKGFDMSEEIREYFGLMYGMTRDAIEAKIMPAVRLDVR